MKCSVDESGERANSKLEVSTLSDEYSHLSLGRDRVDDQSDNIGRPRTDEVVQSALAFADGEYDSETTSEEDFSEGTSDSDDYSSNGFSDADDFTWWPDIIGIDTDELWKVAESGPGEVMREGTDDWCDTGNPDLCRLCRVFFDSWTEICKWKGEKDNDGAWKNTGNLRTPHWTTFVDLKSSASQGCKLCALFVSFTKHKERSLELRGRRVPDSARTLEVGGKLDLRLFRDPTGGDLEYWFLDLVSEFRGGSPATLAITPREYRGFDRQQSAQTFKVSRAESRFKATIQPQHTTDPNSLALPRHWLQDCRKNHDVCRQGLSRVKAPTRLIEIRKETLRLCNSAEQQDCSVYATLSHCWGTLAFTRLLKSNLGLFFNNIAIAILPKTFRDAIEIARALDISYIWIDSLCIVQDDPEDWRKESVRMGSYYGLSSLNIAATAARDGTIGCMFERDPVYAQGLQIAIEVNGIQQIYNIVPSKLVKDIKRASLTKRAWVLQEQILAPRTLHCGLSQFFWDCQAKFASQAFPDGVPNIVVHDARFLRVLPNQEPWENWQKTIQLYSKRKITYESDKLVALSGIARKFHERTGDVYFAGLWRKDFERQLCWVPERWFDHRQYNKPPVQRNPQFPSWSWATRKHATIHLDSDPTWSVIPKIKIVEIKVELESEDPFGDVKSGVLTIESKIIVRCTSVPNERISGTEITINNKTLYAAVYWDFEEDRIGVYSLIFIYQANREGETLETTMSGLLLKHTGHENGQYRREGVVELSDQHFERVFALFGDNFTSLETSVESGLIPAEDYQSVNIDEDGKVWYTVTII